MALCSDNIVRQNDNSKETKYKNALLTKCEVKMAGYWHILRTKTKLTKKTYYRA